MEWLEPLLARILENPKTVAVPIIDIVSSGKVTVVSSSGGVGEHLINDRLYVLSRSETFKYTSSPLVRGGFNWGLHFKWDPVPPELLRTKADFVKPIATPTMAGGLFAVDRQFFQGY